jgi:hypothetical protein
VIALSNARLKQAIEEKGIPIRRDASTIQLDINYRGSTLAHDDRDQSAALRAGDRAPDATKLTTVDGERRLFDLTRGGRFTLLNFGATPAEIVPPEVSVLSVVRNLKSRNEIVDSEGLLAKAYGPSDRAVVLIRPDGYIAMISDAGDLSAALSYLAAIG